MILQQILKRKPYQKLIDEKSRLYSSSALSLTLEFIKEDTGETFHLTASETDVIEMLKVIAQRKTEVKEHLLKLKEKENV